MKISNAEERLAVQLEWTWSLILQPQPRPGPRGKGDDPRDPSTNERNDQPNNHGNGDRDVVKAKGVPRSRSLHACCLLGPNLYLFGGKDRYTPLKDFWKLNIATWQWFPVELKDAALPLLQGHSMVGYKAQVFIFGGTFYETVEETPLWIYNPDLNTVKRYSCEDHLPRPVNRREHSAVTHENVMYIYGGFLDSSGSSGEFWAFDMETEEWREIAWVKPGPRHRHVAMTHCGSMWIHGGMRNLTCLSDVWAYHLTLQTWKKVKTVGASPVLSGHTANVVKDAIVMVGGCRSGKPSCDAWIFSLTHHTWRCIETPKEILFPPLSLHVSVVVDPTRISQNDAETSTKSVPNLKAHTTLLPWHQTPSDARPWTSPMAGSSNDSTNPALELLPSQTALDKNNNSQEDLAGLDMETSFCDLNLKEGNAGLRSSNATSCETMEMKSLRFSEGHQTCSAERSKGSDLLKIRPASCEGCWEESPLLERFHSLESNVELGQNNIVVTLSDENIFPKQNSEVQTKYVDAASSYDNPYRHPRDSYSAEDVLNPKPSYGNNSNVDDSNLLSVNQSSSTLVKHPFTSPEIIKCANFKNKNGMSLSNSLDSFSAVVKENFFANPLYDKLYGFKDRDQSAGYCLSENSINHLSAPFSKGHAIQSSDLIVEDLESCEDDFSLRNVKLASPSNPSSRWSSLKDILSSSKSFASDCENYFCNSFGTGSDGVLSQRSRAKSLSSIQGKASEDILSNEKKIEDLISFASEHDLNNYVNGKKTISCCPQSLVKIRKQSRTSQQVSGAYVKHFSTESQRNIYTCVAEKTLNDKILDKSSGSFYDSNSIRSHLTKSNPSPFQAATRNSDRHFMVPSADLRDVEKKACDDAITRSKQNEKLQRNATSDQRLVLLIFGGQFECRSTEAESLKIWNCYLR